MTRIEDVSAAVDELLKGVTEAARFGTGPQAPWIIPLATPEDLTAHREEIARRGSSIRVQGAPERG